MNERQGDKKTILLVEDEALIAVMEKQTLKKHGFNAIIAHSGEKAIEVARTTPDIDLILMDINLGQGRMDGTEAAQIILKEKEIPVLFLSSYTQDEVVQKTERITSYGYVVKDSGETVLIASIEMAFKLHTANRELKEKERIIRESEGRFRALIEHSYGAVTLLAADGTVLYDSPSVTRILGYSTTDRIGRSVFEFVHPEERQSMAQGFAKLVRQPGAVILSGARFIRKDGTLCWIQGVRSNLLHEPAVRAVVVNYCDITERKEVEEMLRKSEEKYRRIVETTSEGICIYDENFNISFVNPQFAHIFKQEPDALIGSTLKRFAFDEDLPDIDERWKRRMQGISEQYERRYHLDDGSALWVHTSSTPIMDDDGRFIGGFSMFTDITERKQAEEALRESEARAKAMLRAIPDLVFRMDRQGVFLDCKADISYLYAQSEPTIIGKRNRDITPPEFADLIDMQIRNTLETGTLQTFTISCPFLAGAYEIMRLAWLPVVQMK